MKNALHITWVWRNGGCNPQNFWAILQVFAPARASVNPPLRQALAR